MSYRFRYGEPVPDAVRRIAVEEIDKAIEALSSRPRERARGVHSARKHFKKLRALLRLVRDEVGDSVYARENACFRDAGRQLSAARDAEVMVETLARLKRRFGDHLCESAFAAVRKRLLATRRAAARQLATSDDAIAEVVEALAEARQRVASWPLERDSFKALRGGLRRAYERGQRSFDRAYDEPSPVNFHEWRKSAKDLWYHVRLLQPVWPGVLRAFGRELRTMTGHLGNDHDYAVLRQLVLDQALAAGGLDGADALISLVDEQRAELQLAARPIGDRVYSEKPRRFARRVQRYWTVWRTKPEPDLAVVGSR